MSARVSSTFISGGSVEQVLAILTSQEWADTKAQRFGDGTELRRREERPDGGVLVAVSRQLPGGVPGFLERFLPKDGRVLETFDWDGPGDDGARRGTWRVEVPGAPATLGGTLRLAPLPDGSTYTIEGEVTVRLPLVGGRAETFIADMVQRLAATEADLLRDTIA